MVGENFTPGLPSCMGENFYLAIFFINDYIERTVIFTVWMKILKNAIVAGLGEIEIIDTVMNFSFNSLRRLNLLNYDDVEV